MLIRGAVLEEIGRARPYAESRPLTVSELELDAPGDGEVLVRIEAAGLCHSDLSVVDGNRVRPVPMLLEVLRFFLEPPDERWWELRPISVGLGSEKALIASTGGSHA